MGTAVADAPVPITHEGPYVGLRPFEAHERDLFFGRERDAQFLVDKVLSARITVLYAQSGVGKSSLLHTLTIPELEREHCFVVYINTWPAGDLLSAARAALVSAARDVHVADPDAGAPSLRELVGLLAAARNRSLVLVFDQFEEVLAAPGGPPASLRRELAELVRGGVDARVLISMREEFLAALEPFRSEIVTLLQSTYRLDRLDSAGVAKAIVEPVKLFGGTCDPQLVKRLVTDLSSHASRLQDASCMQGVELPLLQLVCKELWEEATKRGTSTLDVDLYEKMGGAAQVIHTYVRRKMPHRWSDKKVAARLLKFLAPPSGMKISYSVADLSAHTRLPARRIRDILEKLCQSQILRSRRVLEDERFELQHDAFIRILVPWRDQVLVRATQYRLAVAAAALIAAMLVAPAAFRRGMEAYEYHTTVRLKLRDLEAQCGDPRAAATILEQITGHLLLRSSRPTRLEDLRNVLVSHERCLPAGYGVTKAGPAFVEQLPPEWRVRLRYSSSRRLDELYFEATWHGVAQRLTAELGVPVPNRIATSRDPTMPARFVELIFPGGDPLRLDDVPIQENRVFFSEAAQSAAAREFLARFKSEWEPLPDIGFAGPWRVVPRWGTPILTATRETALDGSGYLALRLATELRSRPELLVTPAAVDILLNRIRQAFPATVAEAEAVRGALLRSDLVELLKLDVPLRYLPMILDALAGHPAGESPAKAARAVVQDLGAPSVRLPYSAGQPRAERPAAPPPATDDLKPYRDAEKWLPELAAPIRVYLGKELESHWSTREALHPEIVEALEELRDEQWRRFGVLMPGVRFRRSLDRPEMPEWSFQIETLNQESGNPDAGPIHVDLASASQRLIAELRARVEKHRVYWVSAEDVNLLRASLPPALAEWLGRRYSTTDIKTLIRAAISPPGDAPVKPIGTAAATPGSHSARHTRWLLQSMVFWAAVDPVSDVRRMADRLRMTQAALQDRSAQSPKAEPSGDLQLGVDALLAQRDAEAAALFGRAVRAGRDQAIRDFLAAYAKSVVGAMDTDVLAGCTDPTQPRLDRAMLIDLRDMMATRPDRRLKLCLYAAFDDTRRTAKVTIAGDLLAGKGPRDAWPPREAAWFSEQVVRAYDPLRDPPETLRRATTLLKEAATRLEYPESVKLVTKVAEICNSSGTRNWCWDLLDELARARPEGDIPIEVAWQLSWRQRALDLRRALDLAEMVARTAAERGLQAASPARHYDFALFSRANALKGLFEISGEASTHESEKLLRGLLTSAAVSQAAHQQLIEVLLADGRYEEAERLLNSAQEQWSNDATFFMQRFWVDLLQGRTEAAAVTAQRAEKATGASVEGLFVAALGQVLTRSGQWEYAARKLIGSQHQYVDYIAMLLYATQPESQRQEARELLEQRWGEIDPRSWDQRLRGGDESAWRETLIGYYLGKVGRDKFLGVLEDDAAFAGSAFAQLPIPRKGLLCEAYFYDALLAKAAGQVPQMRERLERAMRTGMRFYFEHKMAKFLLAGNSG